MYAAGSSAIAQYGAVNLRPGNWYWNGALNVDWVWDGATPNYFSCQVSTNHGATWSQVLYTGFKSWVTAVPQGASWQFRVMIINTSGQIDTTIPPSNVVTVYGDSEPQNLTVGSTDVNDVVLNFQNTASTDTGFLVQRATDPSFTNNVTYFSLPKTNVMSFVAWTNSDTFIPNTTYYYHVAATNPAGQTFWSLTASLAPNQSPPPAAWMTAHTTAASDNGQSSTHVSVIWSSGGGSVNAWLVQRSTRDTNNWTTINTVSGNPATSVFDDGNLSPGTTYYYQVVATNGAGTSLSNTVTMVVIPNVASATTWYVDLNATGNATGIDWADAWPNLSSINWAAVRPGHTIWISQGNYNEIVNVPVAGTSGSPVTIRVATNSPHAGKVYLQQVNILQPWVALNGSLNDAFTYSQLTSISNNLGFVVSSQNRQLAFGIFANSPLGISIKWCEVGPVGTYYSGIKEGDQTGIQVNGNPATGAEVAYNWVHDVMGDGVDAFGYSGLGWGEVNIHHNVMERIHCNYGVSGAADWHDNWMLSYTTPQVGHPDGLQVYPPRIRIYNNIIKNVLGGRLIYWECIAPNVYDVLAYNNLFTADIWQPAMGIDFTTEPQNVGVPGPYPWPVMTISNVLIANNTFSGFSGDYILVNRNSSQVTDLKLRHWVVANNNFATASPLSQIDFYNAPAPNDFGSSDVVFDWNIVGNGLVNYSASASNLLGLVLTFPHNTTSLSGFSSLYDFHTLTPTIGMDLSSWSSIAPELNVNLDGTSRTATWPIGAYPTGPNLNNSDPNLKVWFTFNSLQGFVHDDSGNAATGIMEDANHWPALVAGPTTNFPNAASFQHIADGSPIGTGQYIALTSISGIDGLTNATISVWARYYPSLNNNYINDQTATIMSCDPNMPGTIGAWYLARNFNPFTSFSAYKNATDLQATYLLSFPDSTTTGDSGGWHHYAVTFDGIRFVGYFDGVPFATNSTSGIDALRIGGNPKWLDIGSWPHGGTPAWGDDEFPNNGWMNGAIADLRIYNRCVTAAEIQKIAAGGQVVLVRPSAPSMLRILTNP